MKPSIFNTEMVRAILDGRKTHTRRPFTFKKCIRDYVKSMGQDYCLKHQNKLHGEYDWSVRERSGVWADYTHQQFLDEYAPYKVGDIIYVRETWNHTANESDLLDHEPRNKIGGRFIVYRADGEQIHPIHGKSIWKPSIHMPKEYARLFLRVKDIRIERLNEISHNDVYAEGFDVSWYSETNTNFRQWYVDLWESIYGNDSFDNRYVWVIEFERISKEEAMSETAT